MVSLVKPLHVIVAGVESGNRIRTGRYVKHLIAHVGILPSVSLVKAPRVSLVKTYAPVYA